MISRVTNFPFLTCLYSYFMLKIFNVYLNKFEKLLNCFIVCSNICVVICQKLNQDLKKESM